MSLLQINMYRRSTISRAETRRKIGRAAIMSTVLTVNILVFGLFIFAIVLADRAVGRASSRLNATEEAMAAHVAESGSISEDQLWVMRFRAKRVSGSEMARSISSVSPNEMWLTRLKYTGSVSRGSGGTPGLRIEGRLKSEREEESLALVMGFLSALRDEPVFSTNFEGARLVSSEWSSRDKGAGLTFTVFCPLLDEN